jgi:hypothetical protein
MQMRRAQPVSGRTPHLIIANGVFLAVMALFGLTQDILSYVWGAGKFEAFLLNDPKAIGFVEAHGLAGLIALAALVCARHNPKFWHALLSGVHALLGSSNVLFFDGFVATGETSFAIVVTAAHFAFSGIHVWMIARWHPVPSLPSPI